jgi:glutathione S-transferase
MTLPRPELSERMGITYRRIPILAIGRDFYADTSLIASTLERRYPASLGYGTLFPQRKDGGSSDTGLAKTLVMYYLDRTVFPLAASSLPFQRFPETFLKDRADVSYLEVRRRTPF